MAERESRQYLVIVALYRYDASRLAEAGPGLMKVLERLSTEPVEQAFRSVNRDVFGYLIRSDLVARQILSAVESPGRYEWLNKGKEPIEPFLNNDDKVMVLSIGPEFGASPGLSRPIAWLQHH
jgi:hypothetical protein